MTKKAIRGWLAVSLLTLGLLPAGAHGAAAAELEAARAELRLGTETERRMREEFESLLAAGRMSAAETADFEDYLRRLGVSVDEQRRRVVRLEGGHSGSASVVSTDSARTFPLLEDFERGLTDEEKIALLDAELGRSISEFDEKLLREQRELAEKARPASTGERGSGSSGEAGEGEGRQAGSEADGKSAQSGAESGQQAGGESGQQAGAGERGEAGGQGAEGNDQMASAGGASDGGRHTGHAATPPDIPDGKDDDIVARQLREAAESEQDPELREKLWEEYRKYKKRTP